MALSLLGGRSRSGGAGECSIECSRIGSAAAEAARRLAAARRARQQSGRARATHLQRHDSTTTEALADSAPSFASMRIIDPHIHCISRTTDDYLYMARAGVVAVSEPAFWAGFDRRSADSFADYFHHLIDVEPKRAAKYGIEHYS